MKKLKLKLEGFENVLSKDQMKKINGGYPQCGDYCLGPSWCFDWPGDPSPCQDCYIPINEAGGSCIERV